MYAVVGCTDCGAFWVVSGRPDTTECRRCGRRHQFENLKRFHESDDEAAAREARGRLLAERADEAEAFAEVEAFDALGEAAEDAGIDDETYLNASGVDADAVADAGERANQGQGGGSSSGSRRETLLDAVAALDDPTEDAVVAYVADRGVPAEAARDGLSKLVRAGELSEHRGQYRVV